MGSEDEGGAPVPDLLLAVDGMGCRRCVREVTSRLRDVRGVDRVVADAITHRVRLSGSMSVDDVRAALVTTGVAVRVLPDEATSGNSG